MLNDYESILIKLSPTIAGTFIKLFIILQQSDDEEIQPQPGMSDSLPRLGIWISLYVTNRISI